MTNTQWFYSHGDSEKGPVSRSQLDALARSGTLKADDLVWHEGLEDWQTAASAGIVTPSGPKAAAGRTIAPPPQPATPQAATTFAPQPATSSESSQVTAPPSSQSRSTTPIGSAMQRLTSESTVRKLGLFIGQPLILFGLVFVLMGRGCDTLGERFAGRAIARSELTKNAFKDEWQREAAGIQSRIDKLRRQAAEGGDVDDEKRDELEKELEELNEDKRREQENLEKIDWRDLEIAARDSRQNHRLWSPWYHLVFVMGTFFLSVGLFVAGFTAQGSDRWICMVMLAIVLFSIYVVGSPWLPFASGLTGS
jgi:hypothetical protein